MAADGDCYWCCFLAITEAGGKVVRAVCSALSISIGLLFDVDVLSGLISTFVCLLRSKGQV